MKRIILVFVSVFSFVICGEDCNKYSQSCSACIKSPDCAWNVTPAFEGTNCFPINETTINGTSIHNPQSSITITQNLPIDENVLLAPQKATVRLRLKNPIYLTISLSESESITPPHLDNIIVELTHDKPNKILAKLEALTCPSESKTSQTITLRSDQSNQTITIEAEILCTCSCEHPDQTVHKSPRCQYIGSFRCGVCECPDEFYGTHCECSGVGNPGDCTYNGTECSNRGTCICGVCECEIRENPEEAIFGRYCECDNFSCARFEGKVCGGKDRGNCICGRCVCRDGWSGENCGTNKVQLLANTSDI